MTTLATLKPLLEKHNFTWLGDAIEAHYQAEDLTHYRGWEIALDIPNGGILAVDIIHCDTQGWWGSPTEEQFGYYDGDAIIAFAKSVIDEVEKELVEVPGQLSLFEVGGDRNA